jgi:phosphoribosylamine--glycine ligase
MRVLILGQGGREHAFFEQLLSESVDRELFVRIMPGNGGIDPQYCLSGNVMEVAAIRDYVKDYGFDTLVVGSEDPLVHGIVEKLADLDVFVFGPNQRGAQLEGSKAWAKAFMAEYGIPTAEYRSLRELDAALDYVQTLQPPVVVKASGLAAGKGVAICPDRESAREVVTSYLSGEAFGEAGKEIVVESFLQGREASLFLLSDGLSYKVLGTAQDYKRAREGGKGPNTGGMGAFSPAQIVDDVILQRVLQQIVEPTFAGLRREGIEYVGILYVGLMIDDNGQPFVVEYNCRMGDPEAQVVLPRIATPWSGILAATRDQRLADISLQVRDEHWATVVLAKEGYPGKYEKGMVLEANFSEPGGLEVFHAGTQRDEKGRILTSGGRVLNIQGRGKDLSHALSQAYGAVRNYYQKGLFYRKDIGQEYIDE